MEPQAPEGTHWEIELEDPRDTDYLGLVYGWIARAHIVSNEFPLSKWWHFFKHPKVEYIVEGVACEMSRYYEKRGTISDPEELIRMAKRDALVRFERKVHQDAVNNKFERYMK